MGEPIGNNILKSDFTLAMLNQGISYQVKNKLNLSALMGWGIRDFEEKGVNRGFSEYVLWFEASVGYRF